MEILDSPLHVGVRLFVDAVVMTNVQDQDSLFGKGVIELRILLFNCLSKDLGHPAIQLLQLVKLFRSSDAKYAEAQTTKEFFLMDVPEAFN